MNLQEWQESNSYYIAASLALLRLRLERLAAGSAAPALTPVAARIESPTMWQRWFAQGANRTNGGPPAARATRSDDQQLARAEADCAAAAQTDPPPALVLLTQQLGLTPFEQDILLLCTAMELDTRIPLLCGRAQGDAQHAFPTFALALVSSPEPSWAALSPERPLRYWRLIEISQPGATPLTHAALRADERITTYIKGLNTLDDRLANRLALLSGEPQLSASQIELANTVLWYWYRSPQTAPMPIVQLLGPDGRSKRLVAQWSALAAQRRLYELPADELPTNAEDLDLFVRLWQRESLLLPLALFVDAQTHDSPEAWRALDRFLARAADSNGLLMLGVRDAMPELAATSFTVDVAKPASSEQREAWLELLADEQQADHLTSQFSFNLPEIRAIASQVAPDGSSRLPHSGPEHDVWEVSRSRTRPRLDTLAQRLAVKATWDDLVLPEEPRRLLTAIAEQVRSRTRVYDDWGFAKRMNRGMGISALFTGESGTGKTMAAEVIANELRLDLYRIDLSAVVSKYIGETEKNLRRLFDAAEDGGAILFFDEADALFGKRSEVKDSHDRYANIEVNYLLQRMEAYGGLAILATNMKAALDQAFMRRLRFVVNFAFPGVAERKAIWHKIFPPETPLDELDYDRLARLGLTGGNIHSIALNAAFLAAREQSPVTMPLLLTAARMELRKLERPINEADFRL